MALALPSRCSDLAAAATSHAGQVINVIGVVTDHLAPSRTRGTDWTCKFSLADLTCGSLDSQGNDGLTVRYFRPSVAELPQISGIGDMVLLYKIKISDYNGCRIALASFASSWALIPHTCIPHGDCSLSSVKYMKSQNAPAVTDGEKSYAAKLCNSFDRTRYTGIASRAQQIGDVSIDEASVAKVSAVHPRGPRFTLIKDINNAGQVVRDFCDFVCQVVRTYTANDKVELSLTDYTTNSLLWNYDAEDYNAEREGDPYGHLQRNRANKSWPGPWGKQVLTVTLWPPHSGFAITDVKVNDFVHLRNVHIKFSDGRKIEGVLHGDRFRPGQINISVIKDYEDDQEIKDLIRRKRDYWKKLPKSLSNQLEGHDPARKRENQEKPLSKAQEKKRKRLERARQNSKPMDADLPDTRPLKGIFSSELNPNVRCSNHTIRPRTLASIQSFQQHNNTTPDGNTYDLPFQNIKSRATVRIIDFYPPNVADFAVFRPHLREYDVLSDASESVQSDGSDENIQPYMTEGRWEWRFCLTLVDATNSRLAKQSHDTLQAHVVGADAEYLLKLDAEDLHKNPDALANLKEKLFLLWGDLQERKEHLYDTLTQAAAGDSSKPTDERNGVLLEVQEQSTRPLQCCLKEYGVKVRRTSNKQNPKEENLGDGRTRHAWRWERRWRLWGCTII